jgi:hypothetical protein
MRTNRYSVVMYVSGLTINNKASETFRTLLLAGALLLMFLSKKMSCVIRAPASIS